jgi:hypothetical protein
MRFTGDQQAFDSAIDRQDARIARDRLWVVASAARASGSSVTWYRVGDLRTVLRRRSVKQARTSAAIHAQDRPCDSPSVEW